MSIVARDDGEDVQKAHLLDGQVSCDPEREAIAEYRSSEPSRDLLVGDEPMTLVRILVRRRVVAADRQPGEVHALTLALHPRLAGLRRPR